MRSLRAVALLFIILLAGCSGLNYSQLSPDAKDFHPKTIAIMPATVGEYEASRDVIDTVIANSLSKSGWFASIADPLTIKTQISNSKELAEITEKFIQKLNTLGISDAEATAKIKESTNSEALLLSYVTDWGYGMMEGSKVAKVGLGIKLIDASKGTVIWKANHQLVQNYWVMKPDLKELSEELLGIMLEEMPH